MINQIGSFIKLAEVGDVINLSSRSFAASTDGSFFNKNGACRPDTRYKIFAKDAEGRLLKSSYAKLVTHDDAGVPLTEENFKV